MSLCVYKFFLCINKSDKGLWITFINPNLIDRRRKIMKLEYNLCVFEYIIHEKKFVDEFCTFYDIEEGIEKQLNLENETTVMVLKVNPLAIKITINRYGQDIDCKFLKDFFSRFSDYEKGYAELTIIFETDIYIDSIMNFYNYATDLYMYFLGNIVVDDWFLRVSPLEDVLYALIKDSISKKEKHALETVLSKKAGKMYGEE